MSRFTDTAPLILRRLADDFGLDRDETAAIVGNLAHECAGFTTLQEENPVVKGSRGGYGWAQWTGPRRLQFEAWCARKGWRGDEFEANYSFLFRELVGPEKAALPKLIAARGLEAKTEAFMKAYLRPGIPHLASRIAWAQKARALALPSSAPVPAPTPSPAPEPKGWLWKLLQRWRA